MVMRASLLDPPAYSSLSASRAWFEAAALGDLATVIAALAVASVGYVMVTGRVPVKRGATVLAGCFIIFGARIIAQALVSVIAGESVNGAEAPPAVIISLPMPHATVTSYDPYAGASVPSGR